jgi:hypothetical protein
MVKKTILFFYFLLIFFKVWSQDLTSYQGEVILPEAKDWSFGVDGTKFIKLSKFDFLTSAQTLTGKYLKDAKTAIRFGVRLGVNTNTSKAFVTDRVAATSSVAAYPAALAQKENVWKRTATAIGLSAGIEKRRGKTRLQGLYGIEAGFFISTSKDKFTYGNALNPSPLAPVIVDSTADAMFSPIFGAAGNINTNPPIQGVTQYARALERKNGVAFSLTGRVFAGAEYFVLPKMSVGGEFGWGFAYSLSGRSEIQYESIGVSTVPGASTVPSVKQTVVDGSKSSSFSLDNSNGNILGGLSASLRINVYF